MGTVNDDRIFLFTRLVAGGVIMVLLLAFIALYIFPSHTDIDFAWTIVPRTSAILIGAGYTAGAYFFLRLVAGRKWHQVQVGFLPITAFTIFMLAATLLHWSRFHQGTFNFYLWTVIYAITPLLVPLVWWHNRKVSSPGLEEDDFRFSLSVRRGLGIAAIAGLLVFLLVFIRPVILISIAAWKLTELTARIFAGWSILTFSTILSIALDGRWSSTRILLESAIVALGLTLLSLPRIWTDLDPAKPITYAFIAGVVLTLIVFIAIRLHLDRRGRHKEMVKAG